MNSNFARGRWMLALALLVTGLARPVSGAEINLARTNFTDRYITNLIDINMPRNVFVNEYKTNWINRFLTNTVVVNAIQTNHIKSYRTNWSTLTVTNQFAFDLLRTNVVERYQTNWATLTLTNWKTVLVMKTNWVAQPVTNVVQIDVGVPATPVAASESSRPNPSPVAAHPVAATAAAPASPPAPLPPAPVSNDISLEASRTARPMINNAIEVQLKVRWTGAVASALLVQQWRVESEDGTILVQAQEKEFRRDLPLGRYKVEVRVKRDNNGPILAARGMLSVTPRDAYVLQKLAAK